MTLASAAFRDDVDDAVDRDQLADLGHQGVAPQMPDDTPVRRVCSDREHVDHVSGRRERSGDKVHIGQLLQGISQPLNLEHSGQLISTYRQFVTRGHEDAFTTRG